MVQIEEHKEGKIKGNKGQVLYDNILFDSKLEVSIYKFLRKKGLQPDYNKYSFELFEGFKPTVYFYRRGKDRKTHKNVFKPDMDKIQNISYTPDFIFDYCGWHVIIEVKGYPNERYPMVRKMFRKLLETNKNSNTIFMEIKTVKEMEQGLKILKDNEKTI